MTDAVGPTEAELEEEGVELDEIDDRIVDTVLPDDGTEGEDDGTPVPASGEAMEEPALEIVILELSDAELSALRGGDGVGDAGEALTELGLLDSTGAASAEARTILDVLDAPSVVVTVERTGEVQDHVVLVGSPVGGIEWTQPLEGVHRLESVPATAFASHLLASTGLQARPQPEAAAVESRPGAADAVDLIGRPDLVDAAFPTVPTGLREALLGGHLLEVTVSVPPSGSAEPPSALEATVLRYVDAGDGGLWVASRSGEEAEDGGRTVLTPLGAPEASWQILDALPDGVRPPPPTSPFD